MTIIAPAAVPDTSRFRTDDERWDAVSRRDRRADGHFFYSVLSTGIYCRPGCPSRLPRRDVVRFYARATEAEAAGFRPCRRCRPDAAGAMSDTNTLVARACRMLENADSTPSLSVLARSAGLSASHFRRLFQAATGVTPRAYAAARRATRMRDALLARDTVTEAIYTAGYGSDGPFYAKSLEMLGMTPRTFRAGGAGETIRYALAKCSFGPLIVAATARGVCEIAFGDRPAALVAQVRKRYANAKSIAEDKQLNRWVEEIVRFIDDPARGLGLPLDVRGTAFQHRVWQALTAVPPGATLSYQALAREIGAPDSARAVARACASNRLAVVIPCHRAVRGDGSLAGYRWGIERKRALLERENRVVAKAAGKGKRST